MTGNTAVATVSPFSRLTEALTGIAPGQPPISLVLGEPQHPVPPFVGPVLAGSIADFGRYPPIRGTDAFREAMAAWLDRRYGTGSAIDPDTMILPLNGSREGLFFAALGAKAEFSDKRQPAIILPNPFYQAYAAGAEAVGAEIVLPPCSPERNDLPDLERLEPGVLDRTIAVYVASPVVPQGSVAGAADWQRLITLARRHRFMLFADECYGELYRDHQPPGALEAANALGNGFANLVSFFSLSKRSNLPGLRCGFAAGDPGFLERWTRLRNMAAPQVPIPVQAVAAAAFADEAHVAENRGLYNAKFIAAAAILGNRFGFRTPPGGFFLWLDMSEVGGGEAAAIRLWKEAGVRTLPGSYLSLPDADGTNPGEPFLRLALVQDLSMTREALTRLAALFD